MKKTIVRLVAAVALTVGASVGVAASAHATPMFDPHGVGHHGGGNKVPNPVWEPH